jgi:hypothetical protein
MSILNSLCIINIVILCSINILISAAINMNYEYVVSKLGFRIS